MIRIRSDTYLIGIWYAYRIGLGKVYIWSYRGKSKNEWWGHVRYRYESTGINIHIDDDHPSNTFICHNISEQQMIKKCRDRFTELTSLFRHDSDYLIIGGLPSKIEKLSNGKSWLPIITIEEIPVKVEKKRRIRKKK